MLLLLSALISLTLLPGTTQDVEFDSMVEAKKVETITLVEAQNFVIETSKKYNISHHDMVYIIEHEGGWPREDGKCQQSNIYSTKTNYDPVLGTTTTRIRENSWGSQQINLDWNPSITKEQACDFFWSTDWTAQRLAEDKFYLWTSIKNTN